jgi:DNA-binding FadR family transcriptional regulator
MKPFRRIRSTRKATSAAYQILNGISSGEYTVGTRLPAERGMAEQMEISRNCVREALSILEAMGIVERKVGSGTYVCAKETRNTNVDEKILDVRESADLLEIWEARKEIECVVVQLAIDRATNNELTALSKVNEAIRLSIAEQDFAAYLKTDTEFHIGIAKAARNLPLENTLRVLKDRISCDILRSIRSKTEHLFAEACFSDHVRLLRALNDRDKEAAVSEVTNYHDKLEVFLERGRREKKGDL